MKIGIVGGGILGLTLALRLGQRGHVVEVLEAAPALGGLACAHDYGPFTWDRFYHCILPQDRHLIGLLRELGLEAQLRFASTATGYYGGGRFHPLSSGADFLRFPLLSLVDKARLAATLLYAVRRADPWQLYRVTAEEWLVRTCGRRGYEVFWRPLLRAKFGPYHDRVAAVFLWATFKRLYGARSTATAREKLGYVRGGGYRRILGAFEERFRQAGTTTRLGAKVVAIRSRAETGGATGCAVEIEEAAGGGGGDGRRRTIDYDQVFFTAPTRLAERVVSPSLRPYVERVARNHPASAAYLGVACLVLVLRRPLTPYYVLNVGDERIELTGVIEMTNLVDRAAETGGLSLVYVPRYLDSDDPRLAAPDEELARGLMERGLLRLFPDLRERDIVYRGVHRARYVQPLPLVGGGDQAAVREASGVPALERPLQILNTSMLSCATLNNNEVVALADRFTAREIG